MSEYTTDLISSSDNDFDSERIPERRSPLLSDENTSNHHFSLTDKADIFGESLSDISADESEHSNAVDDGSVLHDQFLNEQAEDDENWVVRLKIPRIKINTGREMHFIKLPQFLNIESRPFDPSRYVHDDGNVEDMDELERKRLRLKIENTVRWRVIDNDESAPIKQSNARFVQWSDGSLSFYVGDKVFDVFKNNITNDHNHLFIRHGSYLHGQINFRTKLTFRPYSTDSNAASRASIARKPFFNQKIRILSCAGQNPDINRIELIKQEEKRLKREDRRRNLLEKRKEDARQMSRRQLNSRFLERNDDETDDDEEETREEFESDIDDAISESCNASQDIPKISHTNMADKNVLSDGSDEDMSIAQKRNRSTTARVYSSSESSESSKI